MLPIPLLIVASFLPFSLGGNVIIFPQLSRSQLLSASRLAAILNDDGHKVTIVISANDSPDIKPSTSYDILTYETTAQRETEQEHMKELLNFTPRKILQGKASNAMPRLFAGRCGDMLFNEAFLHKLDTIKPDVAIFHHLLACVAAYLTHRGIPYLDFCSIPLMPFLCGGPHRVPANPSYVPDALFTSDEMSFLERVVNTVAGAVMPFVVSHVLLGPSSYVVADYQNKHGLPLITPYELRGKASFLLVHGDIGFESIRPITPKVVHIGGVQCDDPKPLEGELKEFVDGSGDAGIVVFSLGGALDTDALPHGFIETFFDIFREISPRVIWKLKYVPRHLMDKLPENVKLVDWMPQQDLLGHPKTKLFISHGGIQGSFESICHGRATLGVGLFGDQKGNLKILASKGMALMVDDYRSMDPVELKSQITALINDPTYAEAAMRTRQIFRDQPQTPAQRLQRAVANTIRYKGAYHLTPQTAMRLSWYQYYLLDVLVFLFAVFLIVLGFFLFCLRTCWRFCCGSAKPKVE